MVVGSIASIAYGEPRLTKDIDIVVELPEHAIPRFCASFPAPEFYVSDIAVRDAIKHRIPFNVLHPATGNKIDFVLPRADEWGRLQLARRQQVQLLTDRTGYTARPEDVIIGKMWYYAESEHEKHLRDITGILRLCPQPVDRDDVAAWAAKLGLTEIWQAILNRLEGTSSPTPE
jgi:hypothetical protein